MTPLDVLAWIGVAFVGALAMFIIAAGLVALIDRADRQPGSEDED